MYPDWFRLVDFAEAHGYAWSTGGTEPPSEVGGEDGGAERSNSLTADEQLIALGHTFCLPNPLPCLVWDKAGALSLATEISPNRKGIKQWELDPL